MKTKILLCSLILLISSTNIAQAQEPEFPNCTNPNGEIIAEYASGVHGIPGDTGLYTGSDIVYKQDDNALQCFCAENGDGTQSNWYKISSLNSEVSQQLLQNGWIYIPTGLDWGLDDSEYMVKNVSYSCRSEGTGGGDGTGGQILAEAVSTTGNVLGLANTGNASSILKYFTAASALILTSYILKRFESNETTK